MFNLKEEIERLLEKYPLPGAGPADLVAASQRKMEKIRPPCLGIVVDNKDPDCLGRIRVSLDMISPGAVSGWLPIINKWAGKKSGWWQLPDKGVQALVCFLGNKVERGIVLGFIFDEKHRPPEQNTQKGRDSVIWQCKKYPSISPPPSAKKRSKRILSFFSLQPIAYRNRRLNHTVPRQKLLPVFFGLTAAGFGKYVGQIVTRF